MNWQAVIESLRKLSKLEQAKVAQVLGQSDNATSTRVIGPYTAALVLEALASALEQGLHVEVSK